MARQFAEILNECLERLRKGETVEECLARYPEHEGELRPLLKLSASLRLSQKASPQLRASARYKLLAAIEAKKPRPPVALRAWWRRGWVMAVTVVLLILVAGGSTVAAAQGSLPDQPLYPVKLATENIRISLTPSEMGKAKLNAQYAEKRLQEMDEIAQKDNPELVEKLMKRIENHLSHVSQLTVKARRGVPGELNEFVQQLEEDRARAEAKLYALIEKAPPKSRQALYQAVIKARESYRSALTEIQKERWEELRDKSQSWSQGGQQGGPGSGKQNGQQGGKRGAQSSTLKD